jgi:hypothetical protein
MSNSRSASSASATGARGIGHLEVVPIRVHRTKAAQLALLVWRWAVELLLLAALTAVVCRLHSGGLAWYWAMLAVLVAVLFPLLIPRTRRLQLALGWVLVTRHRLRSYFIECRIHSRSGKLPRILFIRPIPVGERVWVWLVPGLSIDDFTHTEDIASACWARAARVERHKSVAALIRLDVVRRDPLTTGGTISSVLVPDTPATGFGGRQRAAEPLNLPRPVIDLNDTGEIAREPAGGRRSSARTSGTNGQSDAATDITPAIPGRGGEDVSDYV